MTLKDRILQIILWISGKTIPVDLFSQRYPISIKGIIIWENKVLLLKNERGEWDLPGGKLNKDISAEACLIREIKEETNLEVTVGKLESTFIYNIRNWVKVFIVVYQCAMTSDKSNLKISGEHFDENFFTLSELESINIYRHYKDVIQKVLSRN
jgi:ADP-ribose pyrophosphatase YjhB (NUDIX family)|tara:strand:+ start:160 stop:621 length:462 start_codon:yes stop_codon:yes gene_type:complete